LPAKVGSEERTQEEMRTQATKGRRSAALTCCLLVLTAGVLAGCRDEEQDRILNYQPGTYLGPEDTQLDQSTVDSLRSRAQGQNFN